MVAEIRAVAAAAANSVAAHRCCRAFVASAAANHEDTGDCPDMTDSENRSEAADIAVVAVAAAIDRSAEFDTCAAAGVAAS